MFEYLQFVLLQQVVAVYGVELSAQLSLRGSLVQALAVVSIGQAVLEIVGAAQVVELLLREVELAAQCRHALQVLILC